jgi:hypothetical protein
MSTCTICGEPLPDGAWTCSVCGTSLHDAAPPPASLVVPAEKTFLVTVPTVPPGGRFCPSCRKVVGPQYTDPFCECGIELMKPPPLPPPPLAFPAPSLATETPLSMPVAPAKGQPVRPPVGSPFLTLVGPEREPLQFFVLSRDATLIGRLDALAGIFPEIDLDEWLDPALARKVSRQHALTLRHRARGGFSLRPLAGNTGTQLDTEMVLPLQDYPLQPGQRLILGGVVRLKFEIA